MSLPPEGAEPGPPSQPSAPAEPRSSKGRDIAAIHDAIMRENTEPADGHEPVPIAWLGMMLALAMFAGSYLGQFNMGFRAEALEGDFTVSSGPGPASGTDAEVTEHNPLVTGKRVFNQCMACHQATGLGVPGQFPPLDASEWVRGDEDTLIRILLHGLHGPVTVSGKQYNGVMPAWARLSDASIADVLSYIRASWSNQEGAVSADSVARVRTASKGRADAYSAEQLLAERGAAATQKP